ncbi:hypothetical protein Q8G28_03870 [Lysinibacillus capsici]|uniref:hypothetical protein n=1 Tax=Lysinibacillus capsici TaxID=2115968 RepID=UPI0027311736|nr:hypothetical protein [Lysinibacillus capsici]MDP1392005.1 hypothetical protein [Lysinibacillus capsici]MDP1412481.1 hypothetical protein [Lysinibacillus capsici]MDP1428887.1 hypothetical protein [Lysinibacillus capsici]
MNEEKNLISFVLQVSVIICSLFYIIYVIYVKEYYDSTPPFLGIVSLSIALIYFCIIGYSKFSKKHLDKHRLKVNDRVVYRFKAFYIAFGMIVLIGMAISLFCVEEISTRVSDILSVLTLLFTLSVELITYCIFWVGKKYIITYEFKKI